MNEGLVSIGDKAFSTQNKNISDAIYIPSTVTTIGEDAFKDFLCNHVEISDLSAWCKIEFDNNLSNPLSQCGMLYLNGEEIKDLIIPETIAEIRPYAFYNGKNLTSVTFNDAVDRIGVFSFWGCESLASLVFSKKLQAIGNSAFGSCSSLTSIIFPDALQEIGNGAFSMCSSLTSVTFNDALKIIGEDAFSGCTGLEEIVIPPSVSNIGVSAFSGNSKLGSIIMGCNVKTIGDNAFYGCPASTVSITAQTPPAAQDNTFSNYTGKLYVQGEDAVNAYSETSPCWNRFDCVAMVEATGIDMGDSPKAISGMSGDTFQLSATLLPDNVTLPHLFWRSTNPDIATVDQNGLVTLHADMDSVMALTDDENTEDNTCKIIVESLYANGPVAEVKVNDNSIPTGIEDVINGFEESVTIDFNSPFEVFSLQGVLVSDRLNNLSTGIYVVRQNKNVKKMMVK